MLWNANTSVAPSIAVSCQQVFCVRLLSERLIRQSPRRRFINRSIYGQHLVLNKPEMLAIMNPISAKYMAPTMGTHSLRAGCTNCANNGDYLHSQPKPDQATKEEGKRDGHKTL